MSKEASRYSAFISYRHVARDRHWAIRTESELETFRTPPALVEESFPPRIGHLFRDEDEIPASSDLSDQIKQALAKSDFLIVVCSPDTPASRWVRREITTFQDLGKADRIIPLLIAGEPEDSFPPELLRRHVRREKADGTIEECEEEFEPIAADVRPRQDERQSLIERRALLRLAAALLGCRYDDLARRDEERRKQALRRKIGLAAGFAATACLAGLWTWDAYFRIKSQYCRAYAELRGVPHCVGPLRSNLERGASMSYRLDIQGGTVLRMARLNRAGELRDTPKTVYENAPWSQGVAEWDYGYRREAGANAGRLASVAMKSQSGKTIRRLTYDFSEEGDRAVAKSDRTLGQAEMQGAGGADLEPVANREMRSADATHSQIGQHILTFDAEGRVIRRVFERLGGGARAADARGAYGAVYQYDPNGLVARQADLDEAGQEFSDRRGVAALKFFYDDKGDMTAAEWVDAAGRPAPNSRGVARVAARYDAHGNIVDSVYFGADGAPTLATDEGVARIATGYDEFGDQIEESYFGVDGKPILNKANGAARVTARLDARGDAVENAFFGLDGQPVVNKANGAARILSAHDSRRNLVGVAFFGTRWQADDRQGQRRCAHQR